MQYLEMETTLGNTIFAANEDAEPHGLAGIWFDNQRHFNGVQAGWQRSDSALLQDAAQQLQAYLAGDLAEFKLPLAPQGTAFQHNVWQALQQIPYGATCTYGELAERMQQPKAVRAVAVAIGRNPLTIVIPCHRVVGSNGKLTGYAGGLERKAWLLALEGSTANFKLTAEA